MLMSKVAISYSSLRDAKGEAKALSRKLDKYADNLDSQVYRKLTSYSGNSTSNITNAKSQLRSKISNLRDASTNYGNYANDIQDLKDECVSVDKAVRTKISKLTASFKKANGIEIVKLRMVFITLEQVLAILRRVHVGLTINSMRALLVLNILRMHLKNGIIMKAERNFLKVYWWAF